MEAVGLAGTVIEFVSFGSKFVRLVWKIHTDDATSFVQADDLIQMNVSIQTALSSVQLKADQELSPLEDGLHRLIRDSFEFSQDLQLRLQKAGFTPKGSKLKKDAFKNAVRRMARKDELDDLRERLVGFRDRLTFYLLASLRYFATQTLSKQEEIARTLKLSSPSTNGLETSVSAILDQLTSRVVDWNADQWRNDLRHNIIQKIYAEQADSGLTARASDIVLSPATQKHLQTTLISTLKYVGMEDRRESVLPTYKKTFEWALKAESSGTQQWDDLPRWLENSSQIYWITGKAGSGKSTLMKFLSGVNKLENSDALKDSCISRCQPFLKKWTGLNDLVIASFYFWDSDSNDQQNSQSALLRTLLYQVFLSKPEIIPVIAPSRWEALSILGVHPQMQSWTETDLKTALIGTVKTLTENGNYVSFFIDGLDEFSGPPKDMVDLIQVLINVNKNVKLCVASRPWVEFQDAFSSKPNLLLEHLTYTDIKDYVTGNFHDHREFNNLQRRNPKFADQLLENIVTKAFGVFLWVKLVVASLLAGITYGDRIEDLQRRLNLLPSDLEKLYDRMLKDLDPFYHEHATQMILLVEAAEENLPLMIFSFADEEDVRSLQQLPSSLTASDSSLRLDDIRRRINSRWKGLIEVGRSTSNMSDGGIHQYPIVQYLHKTVQDFIRSEKARIFLTTSMQNNSFDPHLQLCIAYCAAMKKNQIISQSAKIRMELALCLRHAKKVSAASEADMSLVIDELLTVPGLVKSQQELLLLAVMEGVVRYTRAKLKDCTDTDHLDKLLSVAVSRATTLCNQTIELLLEKGANPDLMWFKLLARVESAKSLSALDDNPRLSVMAFVKYGAGVDDARANYIHSFRNRFGRREVYMEEKFSGEFFDDLKAITPLRRKPVTDRWASWVSRRIT